MNHKQSIGLEFASFDSDIYQKVDIELAVPQGVGHHHGMPSFLKVDGFIAKTITLIPERLKFVT